MKVWKDPRQQKYYMRNKTRILEKRRKVQKEEVYLVPPNAGKLGMGQKFAVLSALGVPWEQLPRLVARDYERVLDAESLAAEAMVVAMRKMEAPQAYTRYQLEGFLRRSMRWALGMEIRRESRRVKTVEMNEWALQVVA